jgi:hypothetical protein
VYAVYEKKEKMEKQGLAGEQLKITGKSDRSFAG